MIKQYFLILLYFLFLSTSSYAQFSLGKIITTNNVSSPTSVFSADLDRDGYIDILSSSSADNKIAWYKNDGNNHFSTQKLITDSLKQASSVKATDLDLDSDLDVIALSSEGEIVIFLNDGMGLFPSKKIITTTHNGGQEIFYADVNLDGDQDIIASFNYLIVYFENDGTGNFLTEKQIYNANKEYDVQIIDFDKDEDQDLLVASEDSNELIWLENDDGNFTKNVIAPLITSVNSIFSADLDGDDDIDVITASAEFGGLYWYENKGTEGFSGRNYVNSNGRSTKTAFGFDADNDGDVDLIDNFPYSARGLAWHENDGVGNFFVEDGYPTENVISFGANSPFGFHSVDLDKDGDTDLVYCDKGINTVGWYENLGNGSFTFENLVNDGAIRIRSISTGDIDSDGDMDVLSVSGSDYKLAWYENKNNGELFEERLIANSYNVGRKINTIDVDGDNDLDIVAFAFSFADGKIGWYENDGTGGFNENVIPSGVSGMSDLFCTDLDGDGDVDILFSSSYDDIVGWHKNDGNGNFSSEIKIATLDNMTIHAADLDDDGLNEVFITSSDNSTVYRYKYEGNDTFSRTLFAANTDRISRIRSGDIDKDGDIDIISMSYRGGELAWFENLGADGFSKKKVISLKMYNANNAHILDLDGDGDNDILLARYNTSNNSVTWFENDGSNEFSLEKEIANNARGIGGLGATDLDQDGDIDIVYGAEFDDQIKWHENLLNYPVISGITFWDENNNGLKDSTEKILKGIPITVEPNALDAYTNANGIFQFFLANNTFYTISIGEHPCWTLTTDSINYNVTLLGNISTGLNFGFQLNNNNKHTQPRINTPPTRCGFEVPLILSIENDGCSPVRGMYGLIVDSLVTLIDSEIEPHQVKGDTLLWNYETLIATETNDIQLIFQMPNANFIGEIIHLKGLSYIEDEQGSLELSAIYDYQSEIRCAYDPNDKLVTPNRLSNYDENYTLFDETLEYTIRFQNTGNDTAFNIVIRDTLDKNLDWTTFRPIIASHAFETLLDENGLVEFSFKNILLADSTTNEPESHGFVTYKILPKKNLAENTIIENTAGIYFDFNPPIITNTTKNILVSALPRTTFVSNLSFEQAIIIYPNPFDNFLNIEHQLSLNNDLHQFSIIDVAGRIVQSSILKNPIQKVSTINLPRGLYLYQVKNTNGQTVANGKVVKH